MTVTSSYDNKISKIRQARASNLTMDEALRTKMYGEAFKVSVLG